MATDNELIALGRLLDEAVRIARERIDVIPDDVGVAFEDREITDASAVPDAIAGRIMNLPARTAEDVAAKAKAIAWMDGVRVGAPA